MKKLLLIAVVAVFLVIGLNGGIDYSSCAITVKLNSNGNVTCLFNVWDIGSNDKKNLHSDFEIFKNNFIETNNFSVAKDSVVFDFDRSAVKVVKKEFWVAGARVHGLLKLQYPSMEYFLNSSSGKHIKLKRDDNGDFFVPITDGDLVPDKTNGKIEKVTEELKSITWPPGTKEFWYSYRFKREIRSFINFFYKEYGKSKKVIDDD